MGKVLRCITDERATYRYLLEYEVGPVGGRRMTIILKNPSTGDLRKDDATTGRLKVWAAHNDVGTATLVNLFAFRASKPAALNGRPYAEMVGPGNDFHIGDAVAGADTVIAAWGDPNGLDPALFERRVAEVRALLRSRTLMRVGDLNRSGRPRHARVWGHSMPLALMPPPPGTTNPCRCIGADAAAGAESVTRSVTVG